MDTPHSKEILLERIARAKESLARARDRVRQQECFVAELEGVYSEYYSDEPDTKPHKLPER